MALPSNSPAVGSGIAADYPGTTTPITTDQRGAIRSSTRSDIGAYAYDLAVPTVTLLSPAAGPLTGGTLVTITGTNFFGNVSVDFGSAWAPMSPS